MPAGEGVGEGLRRTIGIYERDAADGYIRLFIH